MLQIPNNIHHRDSVTTFIKENCPDVIAVRYEYDGCYCWPTDGCGYERTYCLTKDLVEYCYDANEIRGLGFIFDYANVSPIFNGNLNNILKKYSGIDLKKEYYTTDLKLKFFSENILNQQYAHIITDKLEEYEKYEYEYDEQEKYNYELEMFVHEQDLDQDDYFPSQVLKNYDYYFK